MPRKAAKRVQTPVAERNFKYFLSFPNLLAFTGGLTRQTTSHAMRTFTHYLGLALAAFLLGGCLEERCEETRTYTVYEPIYLNEGEFRFTITSEDARPVCQPGQIYYYRDYLLVAEPEQGIHIIDNHNPESPVNLAFLPIGGAQDMAVNDDILYVNNFVDLVSFDLSNPAQPEFLGRIKDVFNQYNWFTDERGNSLLAVEYRPTDQSVTVSCGDPRWNQDWFMIDGCAACERGEVLFATASDKAGAAPGGSGIGGSLARFTIAQGHLYVVDYSSLHIFNLKQNAQEPPREKQVHLGFGIETIFPYGDKLFMGAMDGMHIYDNSDPLNPTQLSIYQHARACDPVYVAGDRAYVTLRDGSECTTYTNQLDVVDVSNLRKPSLIVSHPLHHPIGLSIDGDQLFICDDDQGLKVFDRSNDKEITNRLLMHIKGITTRDIITLRDDKIAIVVGPDGLTQYDYSDISTPRELSRISICP